VPLQLTPGFYFDLDAADARACKHAAYLRDCPSIVAALDGLHAHCADLLEEARSDSKLRSTVDGVGVMQRWADLIERCS